MPFSLGTAEMSLYSLWGKYIKTKILIINQNIILDVEALSLPFTEFYHNCLNKESNSNTKYISYLIYEDIE